MGSAIQYCCRHKLITPPPWLETNLHYECIMGSRAYGCNSADSTDYDIYGICIPPKWIVFPHLNGDIPGFDNWTPFETWQQHHIVDQSAGKQYDFGCYSIVRFFALAYDNNPNIVDSLFVPETCVKHCTAVGHMIRDNRRLFLSKACWPKFRGYAASQFHKIDTKNPEGKRKELVEEFGYDVKYAYHIIRLLDEADQILKNGDLDLQRAKEELKAIRNGRWSYERLCQEFESRKLNLEKTISESKLPEKPDRKKVKQLLLDCLEAHYGSLGNAIVQEDESIRALRSIDEILNKSRHLL